VAQKIVVFLLSAYFGISIYFSFIIAPILFKVLDKKLAGLIVSKIFPSYFWTGLIVFIVSLIYYIKNSYGFIFYVLLIVAIILIVAQIFYILPTSQMLKATNYNEFLKLHLWSIIFNIIVIFINGAAVFYIIYKS
jgi:hypothetical protein